MLNDTLTYTDDNGDEQNALAYIMRDTGDAPCSRYGTSSYDWVPVALATCRIMAECTGELTEDSIDGDVGLVVNDSDSPAYLIASYGTDAERDLLDPDVLAEALEEFARQSDG